MATKLPIGFTCYGDFIDANGNVKTNSMSIASKCTCGRYYYCTGKGDCREVRTLSMIIHENECTPEEANKLKAFLFALRMKDANMEMVENIINKYKHLL